MIRITDDLVIETQGATIPIEKLADAFAERAKQCYRTPVRQAGGVDWQAVGRRFSEASAQLADACRIAKIPAE